MSLNALRNVGHGRGPAQVRPGEEIGQVVGAAHAAASPELALFRRHHQLEDQHCLGLLGPRFLQGAEDRLAEPVARPLGDRQHHPEQPRHALGLQRLWPLRFTALRWGLLGRLGPGSSDRKNGPGCHQPDQPNAQPPQDRRLRVAAHGTTRKKDGLASHKSLTPLIFRAQIISASNEIRQFAADLAHNPLVGKKRAVQKPSAPQCLRREDHKRNPERATTPLVMCPVNQESIPRSTAMGQAPGDPPHTRRLRTRHHQLTQGGARQWGV